MVRRLRGILAAGLFLLASNAAFCDIQTSVDLSDYLALLRTSGSSLGAIDFIQGFLDFTATGNDNVKGELELESDVADTALVSVKRAYAKIRFPALRITAGKTRVSWGDGFFFNAGDVIFGSTSLTASLYQSVLRDDTDLLGSLYLPLDRFSFIEAIVLPNPVFMPAGVPSPVDLSHVSGGGRIVTKLFGTKIEAGYLFNGKDTTNRPYVSFQGNLIIDWNLSASAAITGIAPDFENWKETIAISGGLFAPINLEGSGSISARLEILVRPYALWEEAVTPDAATTYGIYLFPEISYSPDDTLSFLLRSIISPEDVSCIIFGGVYWNVYQGFTLGFLCSVMAGDENDTFGWGKPGDLSFIISLRYIFGTENKGESE